MSKKNRIKFESADEPTANDVYDLDENDDECYEWECGLYDV